MVIGTEMMACLPIPGLDCGDLPARGSPGGGPLLRGAVRSQDEAAAAGGERGGAEEAGSGWGAQ